MYDSNYARVFSIIGELGPRGAIVVIGCPEGASKMPVYCGAIAYVAIIIIIKITIRTIRLARGASANALQKHVTNRTEDACHQGRNHVSKIGTVRSSVLPVPTNVQLQRPKASWGEKWGGCLPPRPTNGSGGAS